ncbi:MAG: Dabb family protein [Saprospiraceae bacterium]
MMKNLLLFIISICCIACQQNDNTAQKINELETNLAKVKNELAEHKSLKNNDLVHIVYLDLKKEITVEDKEKLMVAIRKLSEIPEVKNLELGSFKPLNDPRALSAFEVVFQMEFKDEKDYQIYQAHETHLALKTIAKDFVAGPPVTYDYLKN